MRLILIGDNYLSINELLLHFKKNEQRIRINKDSINDILVELKNIDLKQEDVLVINTETGIGNKRALDFYGIEILKWLRLHLELTNKIILTGFLPVSYILQHHPEHYIIQAPNNHFLKLPFTRDQFKDKLDKELSITDVAEFKKAYKPYVKADFNIHQFGHSFANKFGVFYLELLLENIEGYRSYEFKFEDILEFTKAYFIYNIQTGKGHLNSLLSLPTTNSRQKILYIDDQANEGWANLFRHMFLSNSVSFQSIEPSVDASSGDLISEIFSIQPDLLLLDLRLKGEEDKTNLIQNISGVRLLKLIKHVLPSLPVIIVSATNKARVLTQLLKFGAYGLWTKPRVEEEISALEKYNELIDIVKEGIQYYKYPVQKQHAITDFRLKDVFEQKLSLHPEQKDFLKEFDRIIFDTNAFMMHQPNGSLNMDDIPNLYELISLFACHNKNAFLLVDDVQIELLDHIYKRSKSDDDKESLEVKAIAAKYGLNLVHRIVKSFDHGIFAKHIHPKSQHYYNHFSSDYSFNQTENQVYQATYVHGSQDKEHLFTRMYYNFNNERDDDINKAINKLQIKNHRSHADDAFLEIIFNGIVSNTEKYRTQNILFVSDDKECKDNLIYTLNEYVNKYGEGARMENIVTKKKFGAKKIIEGELTGNMSKDSDKSFKLKVVSASKLLEMWKCI